MSQCVFEKSDGPRYVAQHDLKCLIFILRNSLLETIIFLSEQPQCRKSQITLEGGDVEEKKKNEEAGVYYSFHIIDAEGHYVDVRLI